MVEALELAGAGVPPQPKGVRSFCAEFFADCNIRSKALLVCSGGRVGCRISSVVSGTLSTSGTDRIRGVSGFQGTSWGRTVVRLSVKTSTNGTSVLSRVALSLGMVDMETGVIVESRIRIKVNRSSNVWDIDIAFAFRSKLIYVICLKRK